MTMGDDRTRPANNIRAFAWYYGPTVVFLISVAVCAWFGLPGSG